MEIRPYMDLAILLVCENMSFFSTKFKSFQKDKVLHEHCMFD
jgi:hypothetical protein